ncbi:leukocyte surface antigen CD53 [Lutzomyia longipalpis]|uniref:Putative tetraspanin family n=1 Tax=Lutzomyia longipalpis TaxID=7200 RepID=A0A7G3AZR4_LUTLO|nr:leukocyte surface antigen CD53 [Lutzomyia longipalpis]
MKLATRIKCLVYFLYSYAIFLAVCGVVLVIFGGYILYNHLGYGLLVEGGAWGPSAATLCLGLVTICITWMGWNAIAKRNQCRLYLFGMSLLGIILISVFLCIWSLTIRKDIQGSAIYPVESSFSEFIADDTSTAINDHTHLWNRLQSEMQCCGVHGITDYIRISIPWSCCRRPENPSDPRCVSSYQRGCLFALIEETKQRLIYISVAALIFALVQVMGIFMVVHLVVLLKEQERGDVESRGNSRNTELLPFNVQTADTGTRNPSAPPVNTKSNQASLHESLHADLKKAQAQRLSNG